MWQPPSCSQLLPRRLVHLLPRAAAAISHGARAAPAPGAQVFVEARRQLGEVLSAFEFLDAESLGVALAHLPGARDPLPASQVHAT